MIVLSSGESELYAALKVAVEGLGVMSVLCDLGWYMKGEVWGDASVALGIINRRGFGKTRHIDIGHLWVQEVAAKGRPKFEKVLGRDNPADFYTKYFDEKTNLHHTTTLAYRFTTGRAEEAPQLHKLSQSRDDYEYGPNDEACEWVNGIMQAVQQVWSRRRRANNNNRGEIWICHESQRIRHKQQEVAERLRAVADDLGQLVLQGRKRPVQGSNGLNPAQPRRPWGPTRTGPSGHNRVQYLCPDGHATSMGCCSHTLGGFAGRQDPVVLRERSHKQSRSGNERLISTTIITINTTSIATNRATEAGGSKRRSVIAIVSPNKSRSKKKLQHNTQSCEASVR